MTLDEFARSILFGTTLEEKLVEVAFVDDVPGGRALTEVPSFPGRPPQLRIGTEKFPSTKDLANPTTRGHVLHFFANHELLAMELMALVLLRFPEAPAAFRLGLARTIREEQSHMRLYLERMQELGVEFGDLPLSDYFWKCLKTVRSPVDFVVQMSLTFEQANLDYSLYYRDQVARHGDEKTAAILDRVYREEIGHVKHGLAWFNRWRDNADQASDWDAYRRLLPPPLTPRRAKGLGFSAASRREAGFSETFIDELALNASSKGRPPVLWLYNPSGDAEIARGKPGFLPSKPVQQLARDLESLLMMLARDSDMVWVRERPRVEWLQTMAAAGFRIPEFFESDDLREPKLGGLEPWCWSPEVFERLRPFGAKLVPARGGRASWAKALLAKASFEATGLGPLFSKAWSARWLEEWLQDHPETRPFFDAADVAGRACRDEESARQLIDRWLSRAEPVAIKAPYGTAGNQVKRVTTSDDVSAALRGWMRNTLDAQGALVVEPWLDKVHDLSIQFEVGNDGVKLFEVREFLTDAQGQYRGAVLGRRFAGFSPAALRVLNESLPHWHRLLRELARRLREQGYRGPAGVDALIWRTRTGDLRLKPLVELNPRWTMGRVALALEHHVDPGVTARWLFLKRKTVDVEDLQHRHPAQFIEAENGRRITSGIFWTTDPSTARMVCTALVVGDLALRDLAP